MKKIIYILICFMCCCPETFAQISCNFVSSFDTQINPYPIGVAFDGTDLWASYSSSHYIYKFSTAGVLLDSISDPACGGTDNSEGIVFANGYLYSISYGCDTMYQTDLNTKTVVATFTGMPADDRPSIAYDGMNTLYFASGTDFTGSYKFDLTTGTFTPFGNFFAHGLCFIGSKLYGINSFTGGHIFEVDTATGSTFNNQIYCPGNNVFLTGIAYDGTDVWQANLSNTNLYRIALTFPHGPSLKYVTVSGAGLKDGSSWGNALDSIGFQPTLAAAYAGDTFWVAAGNYKPTYSTNRNISFKIHDGVNVFGGFNGTETLLSQRDVAGNITILDGDIGNASDSLDNSYRIVEFDHVSNQTQLDGFTLQNAHNDNPNGFPDARGGAIYNDGTNSGLSAPVISNCIVQNNYATSGGGVYSNASGNGEVGDHFINCVFENNHADVSSGGAYRAANANGGGIIQPVFDHCIFSNNAVADTTVLLDGGAIYLGSAYYHTGKIVAGISACIFTGNTSSSGAAVYVAAYSGVLDSITISNCEFTGNVSSLDGPGVCVLKLDTGKAYLNYSHCSFKGNAETSGVNGGALTFRNPAGESFINVDNCLITGNKAGNGAGIYFFTGGSTSHVSITNTTVSGNSSDQLNGSLFVTNWNINPVDIVIHNSIIYGNNFSISIDTVASTLVNFTTDNSVIEGGFTGTNILTSDPLFDTPNSFSTAPDVSGNYKLLPSSPAINTGDNNFVIDTTDLLGNIRIFNTTVDMGCYEYPLVPLYAFEAANSKNDPFSFPNPASGSFQFQFYSGKSCIAKFSMINILGEKCLEAIANTFGGINTFEINSSQLQNGIYLLQVETSSEIYYTKIMIQK